MKKTARQLDREIAEALAALARAKAEDDDSYESFEKTAAKYEALKNARAALMRAAFEKSPAIILDDGRGRRTLVIKSVEPYDTSSGSIRASYFDADGPVGHVARKTLDKLIDEINDVYHPHIIRPASDAEVMAWTSTDEFARGAEQVARVMAANERGSR